MLLTPAGQDRRANFFLVNTPTVKPAARNAKSPAGGKK